MEILNPMFVKENRNYGAKTPPVKSMKSNHTSWLMFRRLATNCVEVRSVAGIRALAFSQHGKNNRNIFKLITLS